MKFFKNDLSIERKIIEGGSSKEFFSYVKKKTTYREPIPPLMKASGGSYEHTDSEKASILNNYFCSVFTKDNTILPTFVVPEVESKNISLGSVLFSEYGVSQKIKKLKNHLLSSIRWLYSNSSQKAE